MARRSEEDPIGLAKASEFNSTTDLFVFLVSAQEHGSFLTNPRSRRYSKTIPFYFYICNKVETIQDLTNGNSNQSTVTRKPLMELVVLPRKKNLKAFTSYKCEMIIYLAVYQYFRILRFVLEIRD